MLFLDAELLINCQKPLPFSFNMAIRRSQMNSLLPPARRERDGLLSDIFQVSLQDEEQIVAGQPRGPLRWARDGELGQATSGGHLNEPSLSLRLFLKHPFGSARFSLTTLPDPPCSAPPHPGPSRWSSRVTVRLSRTSVTSWGPSHLRLPEFFIVSMAKEMSLYYFYTSFTLHLLG